MTAIISRTTAGVAHSSRRMCVPRLTENETTLQSVRGSGRRSAGDDHDRHEWYGHNGGAPTARRADCPFAPPPELRNIPTKRLSRTQSPGSCNKKIGSTYHYFSIPTQLCTELFHSPRVQSAPLDFRPRCSVGDVWLAHVVLSGRRKSVAVHLFRRIAHKIFFGSGFPPASLTCSPNLVLSLDPPPTPPGGLACWHLSRFFFPALSQRRATFGWPPCGVLLFSFWARPPAVVVLLPAAWCLSCLLLLRPKKRPHVSPT